MNDDRRIVNFNTGWLYLPYDNMDARLQLFDDSNFEPVTIPHANKVLEIHKGDDFQGQIEAYRFISWYRRHFIVPDNFEGMRIIIEFQGVATVAEVYVNGEYVGSHKGAYTGFSFDITDYVNWGNKDNVIAIRVDSTKHSDIPPEGGDVDYCLFGGIVRNVILTIVNSIYVETTFITTPDLSIESGKVNCSATVRNCFSKVQNAAISVSVCDAEGSEVAYAMSDKVAIPAKERAEIQIKTAEIVKPRLWSVDTPYLYTVKVQLLENDRVVDTIKSKIGLRWFEFTNKGFYLNGEKLKLRGVNRHEQWPWQGRAIPDKLQRRDADMIKNTGLNAVRCSHYPQAPEFLSRCDELGLIVFEEAPGWQHIGDEAWQEVYKSNVREMIIRDRNHPSIVTWGVRVNESRDNHDFVSSSVAIAKELDPTRPTHGVRQGDDYERSEKIEDLYTVNYRYPEIPRYTPYIITEHSGDWGGDGCPWSKDDAAMRFTKSFGDALDYYYGNEFCSGGFAWSMFDYNNEVNYMRTGHVFYSGLYDIWRLDKPASYLYRSQKDPDDEVVLYIANYWTEQSPSEVEIYSNCDEVELFVNGNSKGRIKPNLYMNIPHPSFLFEGISFEAGEIEAVGYIAGREKTRTCRRTPESPARLVVTPDYNTLIADGADMTCVTVELLDKNGTRLPYADNKVKISVDESAELIGEQPVALEGGRVSFIVKSRLHKSGNVTCTVTSDSIEGGSCTINILEYEEKNIFSR